MNLYDIDERLQNLLELEEQGIEGLNEAIESVQMEESQKIDNILKFIKSLQYDEKSLKEEEQRLKKRRDSVGNKIKSLREYLFSYLKGKNMAKYKTLTSTVSIATSKPKLVIDETYVLPKEYIVEEVKFKPNKELIEKSLNEGLKIDGCEFKELESLRIR